MTVQTYSAGAAEPINVISNTVLRVQITPDTGVLEVTDLRNRQQWTQTLLEDSGAFNQKLIRCDEDRRTLYMTCTMAASSKSGQVAPLPFDLTVCLRPDSPAVELTFKTAATGMWRQAAYPYAFLRREKGMCNLYPHAEGLLIPVHRNDPGWLRLPDGNFYSGVKSYLACLGLVDLQSGQGLLTILPSVESTHIKWWDVPGAGGDAVVPQIVWSANKYRFDRPYQVIYTFSDAGGYVALARQYRDWFAAQGLRKTLKEKAAENPTLEQIAGAPVFWTSAARSTTEVREMADILKGQGIDRCLFALSGVFRPDAQNQSKQDLIDTVQYVNSLGYVTYRYDQYRDTFLRDPTAKLTRQINTDAYPQTIVKNEQQKEIRAFGPTSGVICPTFFIPLATRNLQYEFSTFAYSAWFLDCLGSVGFNAEAECWDPAHPCDVFDTRREREELMKLVNQHHKLAGTECGLDYLIPYTHWFEGATTLVAWMDQFPPANLTDSPAPAATSSINDLPVPAALPYQKIQELDIGHTAPPTISLSTAYRIPFYSLVHHDEVITTWRWEDGMNSPPAYWVKKILWSVLYGAPPMYRPFLADLKKYQHQIGLTEKQVSQWVRQIAFDAMTDHAWLTPDRSVQQTLFSSGRGVVANFGCQSYTIPDGPVLPAESYATFTVSTSNSPNQKDLRVYDHPVVPLQTDPL